MGRKRLIVACDGTWVNSNNSPTTGRTSNPSNVTRICRALKSTASDPNDADGIEQIVYYQAGLASSQNWYSYIGGYVGAGIGENVRAAFSFIANNYEAGDEIFLIGFSRGAFTARSIAAFISSVGVLTKKGLEAFYPIFMDWENQNVAGYKPSSFNQTWPLERPSFRSPEYMKLLIKNGFTLPDIPIKAVAVFDTVGALGVPTIKILGYPFFSDHKEYAFINTQVAPNIENAFQALAIDEQREPFLPTVWEYPSGPSNLKILKQTWFAGVHTTVGGGYQDTSISDLTLAWMVTQLEPFLEFDPGYCLEQRRLNEEWYKTLNKSGDPSKNVTPAPWGMGMIKRSDAGFLNTMTGRQVRTPGDYYRTDPDTGKQTTTKLRRTNEFIHPSVRYRIEQKGPGLASPENVVPPGSVYKPAALEGWVYHAPENPPILPGKEVELKQWGGRGIWVNGKTGTFIVEDQIARDSEEMKLVESWPKVEDNLGVHTFGDEIVVQRPKGLFK